MITKHPSNSRHTSLNEPNVRVNRHNQVCEKLQISSAKLFDMVARGQFPKPFTIIPGGRAVGWLESDVTSWILERKDSLLSEERTVEPSTIDCSPKGECHE
jgi:prophage regulatory protein